MAKLLSQQQFDAAVFARDDHRCVGCGAPAANAHHLIDHTLFEDGGYYLDQGVSLCADCHILAEKTLLSADELRSKAGIKQVILPEHFDPNLRYDKWGNVIVNQQTRFPGELFYKPSVQEILASAGILDQFDKRVKYPRTMHLAWSPGLQNDDRRLITEKYFSGEEVVFTEKLDGENTTMGSDYIHARSLDSKHHPSRDWVKQLHGRIKHEIPEGWRICGENVYARHSLAYDNLDSYFFVFGIWDRGTCLPWDETTSICGMLGIHTVPVLWSGTWDRDKLVEVCDSLDPAVCEGGVVRVTRSFEAHEFPRVVGKYVRRGHVQTSEHWMEGPVIPNKLSSNIAKE